MAVSMARERAERRLVSWWWWPSGTVRRDGVGGGVVRAAILEDVDQPLVLRDDVVLAGAEAGEVIVRVEACGVCHSDLSAVDGAYPVPLPVVLGHEAAGVVEQVGPGVVRVAPGDHVVLTPVAPCGRCYFCLRHEPGVCVNTQGMVTFSLPDGSTRLTRDGQVLHRGLGLAAFADRVVALENAVVQVPDDVPLDVACVVGCGVQTGVGAVLNTAGVEEGGTVLVVGLGGVGLSVVQGAVLAGASRIIVSDPVPGRRAQAVGFGATDELDPTVDDVIPAVLDLTTVGVDYAFEAAGRTSLISTCLDATRPGGTTVMVGAPPLEDSLTIPATVIFGSSEKKLLGCLLGSSNSLREIPRLIGLWRAGRLDLESLVTARRPLDEVNRALQDMREQQGIRTVLRY
jgi:Zn-dependent alcohol dehydrogenase